MPVYKNEEKKNWYTAFYYTDWTGKRKKKKKEGFKTKREAQAFERDFIDRTSTSPTIKFSSLVENYLEDCKCRIKPTSFYQKENLFKRAILPYFKDTPLNEINPQMVRKWQNDLMTSDNGYKETYLKTLHNQLSAIFNYAVKYYNLKSNPARMCGNMGKETADGIQFWTFDEFNIFISYVKDKNKRLMFEILFYSGMRSGELLALCPKDFDFEKAQ